MGADKGVSRTPHVRAEVEKDGEVVNVRRLARRHPDLATSIVGTLMIAAICGGWLAVYYWWPWEALR